MEKQEYFELPLYEEGTTVKYYGGCSELNTVPNRSYKVGVIEEVIESQDGSRHFYDIKNENWYITANHTSEVGDKNRFERLVNSYMGKGGR